jgi:hypothetical protein
VFSSRADRSKHLGLCAEGHNIIPTTKLNATQEPNNDQMDEFNLMQEFISAEDYEPLPLEDYQNSHEIQHTEFDKSHLLRILSPITAQMIVADKPRRKRNDLFVLEPFEQEVPQIVAEIRDDSRCFADAMMDNRSSRHRDTQSGGEKIIAPLSSKASIDEKHTMEYSRPFNLKRRKSIFAAPPKISYAAIKGARRKKRRKVLNKR